MKAIKRRYRSPFRQAAFAASALVFFSSLGPLIAADDRAAPPVSSEAELAAAAIRVPDGMSVKTVASEPHLANPVAFCFDPRGRIFVVETYRLHKGVEDNRNHMDWLDDDLAARTVADRRAYTIRRMGDEIGRYTEADDLVRLLEDRDGDGLYETSQIFSSGYNDVEEGAASGALWIDDRLWLTNIPSLYELRDTDGDGIAEDRKVLVTGFGVHFAFIGHDLHGLCLGPDGKVYFSIGDRGLHVETPSGILSNHDSGAVLRCNPDGSELELFATGLRNPQELAFNEVGDLFTVDNNSDSGDRARLIHLVEGMDVGWRMSYQYLPDRGPFNRERIWHTQNPDQPASIVPPLTHLSDGPSGLVFYPGTGLPAEHQGAFFLCDFRGQSSGSGVRQFWVEPAGATYRLKRDRMLVEGVLATDCDFGPDGALYISDWIDGWSGTGKGRIHRVTSDDPDTTAERAATQAVLSRIGQMTGEELLAQLSHADRRVRAEAQRQLVKGGQGNADALLELAGAHDSDALARYHAIWALGELAESEERLFDSLAALRNDEDAEVRAQVVKTLSRAKKTGAKQRESLGDAILPRLSDPSPRVRLFTAITLGNLRHKAALRPLLALAAENQERDPVLRHGVAFALAATQEANDLVDAAAGATESQRLAVVVALGRKRSPLVASFLHDDSPSIPLEAARAIWDVPIPEAYGELAGVLESIPSDSEPLVRRALAASSHLGTPSDLRRVVAYALRPGLSETLRDHAWEMVRNWDSPSSRDPVLGQWRPVISREPGVAKGVFQSLLPQILDADDATPIVVAAELGVADAFPPLNEILEDGKAPARLQVRALGALAEASEPLVARGLDAGLESPRAQVRSAARRLLVRRLPDRAVDHLCKILESATTSERQTALALLAEVDASGARETLSLWLDKVEQGECPEELMLDVLDAVRHSGDRALKARYDHYWASRENQAPPGRFAACLEGGDARRGRRLFEENTALSCRRCHSFTSGELLVGPNLADIGRSRSREELLTSIVNPNDKITEGFRTTVLQLDSGKVVSGIVRSENETRVVLVDPDGKEIVVEANTIDDRFEGKSAMPEDLMKHLPERDLRDLVEYLSQLRDPSSTTTSPTGGHGGARSPSED